MAERPVHVAVTGAAGQIGYAIVFRIASGQLLGPDQPIVLRMLEIEPAMKALEGVAMELEDCAFPLLHDMELTSKAEDAFDGVSWALLVGSVGFSWAFVATALVMVPALLIARREADAEPDPSTRPEPALSPVAHDHHHPARRHPQANR